MRDVSSVRMMSHARAARGTRVLSPSGGTYFGRHAPRTRRSSKLICRQLRSIRPVFMDVWVWVWTLWVGWGEGGRLDSLQEKQREKCAFVGVVGGVLL